MNQADIVLAALKRGPLTKLEAFKLGAGLSLNSRVADLRAQGWDIACEVKMVNGRRSWVYTLRGPVQGQLPLDGTVEVRA